MMARTVIGRCLSPADLGGSSCTTDLERVRADDAGGAALKPLSVHAAWRAAVGEIDVSVARWLDGASPAGPRAPRSSRFGRPEPPAMLADADGDTLLSTVRETELSESTFPQACPFTVEQALDPDYRPEAGA